MEAIHELDLTFGFSIVLVDDFLMDQCLPPKLERIGFCPTISAKIQAGLRDYLLHCLGTRSILFQLFLTNRLVAADMNRLQ